MVAIHYRETAHREYQVPSWPKVGFNWRLALVLVLNAAFWVGLIALIMSHI